MLSEDEQGVSMRVGVGSEGAVQSKMEIRGS